MAWCRTIGSIRRRIQARLTLPARRGLAREAHRIPLDRSLAARPVVTDVPAAEELRQTIELTEAAEDLGLDGAFVRVHHCAQQLASPFPGALDLAGVDVDPLASDLPSMLIKSHYDAHKGPPQAPRFERLRAHAPRLS